MSITFSQYAAHTRTAPETVGIVLTRLHRDTETLFNAYWRDWSDPNLGEFRPDLEEWMRQQLGAVLRDTAAAARALGVDLEQIATRDVTQT